MFPGKAIRISLVFLCLFTTSGCWDRQEVDKLAIVTGLGIDLISGPEPYLITAQVVSPASQTNIQESSKPFVTTLAHGKTISEAIHNFSKESPRKMFFAHNNIVVMSEKLARSGIQDFLDFLDRSPQFRRNAWLIVTPRTAKEVLQTQCDIQKYAAIGLKEMIYERYHPFSNKMQRKDTMSRLEGLSSAALALKIDIKNTDRIEQQKLEEAGNPVHNSSQQASQEKDQLQISGFSILNKYKFAGYLNDFETQGLLWFLGQHKGYPIRLPCPTSEQKYVVFLLNQKSKHFKPVMDQEPLQMIVKVSNNATMAENNCSELSLFNAKDKENLEKKLNEAVKQQMMVSLEKVQRSESDVLHFADAFYRKNPAQWKKIRDGYGKKFSETKVTITVKSEIRLSGMTSEGLKR
ncbi:spore germination protein KC [Paenibacillus taihuensis]|uniref:Spore germination protein KC n=1 Tax=Paenibacillus taihuensis TaxID=1156355 RepID=A0A3D9SCG0_9BACL|nr:Ger(x)C family spore germination protein [Paenibacillus taihuensis]REE87471.1 spore germination protein KC [Paenibacillus taihuensis]